MLAGKKLRQCIAMNMIWNLLKHRNSWTFADNIFYISIRLLRVFILEMVRFDKRYLGASWGLTADTLEPTARHACQHNTTDTTQHNTTQHNRHNTTRQKKYNTTEQIPWSQLRQGTPVNTGMYPQNFIGDFNFILILNSIAVLIPSLA